MSQWNDDSDPYGDEYADDDYCDSYGDEFESATIECSKCGREIYEDSPQCPGCGTYVTRSTHAMAGRPAWFVVVGIIGLFLTMFALVFAV